ncbi:MAG: acetylxylan esterase [Candidatus Hydrogenedentota bacterium]|nr:MAG: acetylxylan esterase [Candidatus Hydrogenedentota bacterium]
MDVRAEQILDELFKYDENLPLEAVERQSTTGAEKPRRGESRQYHVTFASVHDQRVPALLTLPSNATPPFPAILFLHGVLGNKDSPNQRKRSAFLASAGYATLRIDGQYRGEREVRFRGGVGLQTEYYYRNRDAMIQTAIDLMRGVDYLASRDDIDLEKVGFAGFSMGGAVGTLFCAHDPRVRAVVLAITGGNFGKFRKAAGDKRTEERIRRAYRIVDPVLYVSRISPRPLLMLNAARDEIVPRAATEALFEAAREPKRIIWYDCGHAELPDENLNEMGKFFDAELRGRCISSGKESERVN